MKNKIYLLSSIGLLVACGGGGGNSTPVTQTASNRAPTVSINSVDAVDEGEVFEIDASASSDPDVGDTLSFSISQTAGPTAEATTLGNGVFEIQTGRVAFDQTMTFQISVSDGQATSTASIDVAIRDTPAEPRLRMTSDSTNDISVSFAGNSYEPKGIFALQLNGEPQFGVVTTALTPTNGTFLDNILFLEPIGSSYTVRQSSLFEIFVATYDFLVVQDIFGSTDDDFAVVNSETGEVILYGRNPSPARNGRIDNYSNQSAVDPCLITFSDVFSTSNGRDMIVGKRQGGIDLYRNDTRQDPVVFLGRGSYERVSELGFGNEVCIVFDSEPPISSGRSSPDIFAIDTQSGEIATIIDNGSGFVISQTLNNAIMSDPEQELTLWVPFVDRVASGLQGVAVYSDGEFAGSHAIYIISRNLDGTPVVERRSWPEGPPSGLAIGDADEDGDVDIVVVSEQNSDAIVFVQSGLNAEGVPEFGDAAYFQVGLGASGVAALPQGALAGDFFVTYRDDAVVRSFFAN